MEQYGRESGMEGEQSGGQGRRPDFSVKAAGKYVGSGWLSDGKWGKYIALKLNEPVEAGQKVFVAPRKGSEKILG